MTAAGVEDLPPLPNFLILGAQKSATRWLRTNIGKHPDIFAADTEISFFTHRKRYEVWGPEWYRAQFSDWRGEGHIGEATPGYMMWRHRPAVMAERVEHLLGPDVKLVAILRNPVERANSALAHHIVRQRLPVGTDLMDHVRSVMPDEDRLGIVNGGWYGASLEPYRERFGQGLLVLLHDDIKYGPEPLYRAALEHLGAEASFVPKDLPKVRFSNQDPTGEEMRRTGGLTPDARVELYEYFREDIERLGRLTDLDLSVWDPPK